MRSVRWEPSPGVETGEVWFAQRPRSLKLLMMSKSSPFLMGESISWLTPRHLGGYEGLPGGDFAVAPGLGLAGLVLAVEFVSCGIIRQGRGIFQAVLPE